MQKLTIGSIALLALATTVVGASECPTISESTARRLEAFVQRQYRFPSSIALRLAASDIISTSCYRKIRFRADRGANPVEIVTFLTPDQQFLSRELLDTTKDPIEEEQRRRSLLEAGVKSGHFPVKGSEDAPVTITVFSDFQCPVCRKQVDVLNRELSIESRHKVRLVFRNFPLSMHMWARAAAEMAACAYRQSNDAFWEVHDFVFSHQQELTPENLKDRVAAVISGRMDIDSQTYETCVRDRQGADAVDQDVAFATEHRIQATPTVFINGILREGVVGPEEINALILRLTSSESDPRGAQ